MECIIIGLLNLKMNIIGHYRERITKEIHNFYRQGIFYPAVVV